MRCEGNTWQATEAMLSQLSLGRTISGPRHLLSVVPDKPLEEMHVFELLCLMEQGEWLCRIVSSKSELSRAKDTPYVVCEGHAKVW